MDELTELIQKWGIDRGIDTVDPRGQMLKVVEEVGEIASALARGDADEFIDAVGDTFVTLVMLTLTVDLDIKDCVQLAYDEIKDRDGKVVNGVFVKLQDLDEKEAM